MKKIAFCFLILDSIHHEELWYQFLQNVDTRKYSIYIHYKTNQPLKYFESYKLKHCIETSWGDLSLVHAQNLLLKEALQDSQNEHFIFVSGSCIPLKHFDTVYSRLDPSFSYFSDSPQSSCFPRCNHALNYLDKKFIHKSSQWCILNKKHATLMLEKPDYLEWFDVVPDEHCYLTNLYVHSLEHELVLTLNTTNVATTFTHWDDSGLKNYSSISQDELTKLLTKDYLFGRKFNKECDLSHLELKNPRYELWLGILMFVVIVLLSLFTLRYLKLKKKVFFQSP